MSRKVTILILVLVLGLALDLVSKMLVLSYSAPRVPDPPW